MLSNLQYRVLRQTYSGTTAVLPGTVYHGRSKLRTLLGEDIFDKLRGKTVVDFGCGYGDQTLELAAQGVKCAIGVDIRDDVLDAARNKMVAGANAMFVHPERCPRGIADFVLSIDSFEHFADPAGVLRLIYDLLAPHGTLLISFGPPWLHPLGGHDFSIFPWAHLLLSERALCRWYSDTRHQDVRRFEDVRGGLNRMTISKFERLVQEAPYAKASVTALPIRKLRRFHNRVTREFTTSVVRCELVK